MSTATLAIDELDRAIRTLSSIREGLAALPAERTEGAMPPAAIVLAARELLESELREIGPGLHSRTKEALRELVAESVDTVEDGEVRTAIRSWKGWHPTARGGR